jgi:hypothetical protein
LPTSDDVKIDSLRSDSLPVKKIGFEPLKITKPIDLSTPMLGSISNKKAKDTICGPVKTKWKELDEVSLEEGEPKNIHKSKRKCTKCGKKKVEWTNYIATFKIKVKVQRLEGTCPLKKGHKGDHKGLKPKTEYRYRVVYQNKRVKTGSCGCELISTDSTPKWKDLTKWRNQKIKQYKKNRKK